jgi:uncharacterized protein (TIGR03382 family)
MTKRKLATEASVALLRATLDPQQTKAEKMATVEAILTTYLSYSPGCTFDNNWCDAAERQYTEPGATIFGCSCGGGGLSTSLFALLALTTLSRRRKRTTTLVASLIVAAAVSFTARNARAQDPPQPPATTEDSADANKHAPPPPATVPVTQPGPVDPSEGAWGAYLGVSGSVDKPAFAVQLGVRRRLSTHWTIGLDVEENAWVAVTGPKPIRAGVLNAYATVILRYPLAYENFNLRTTLNVGASYLLIDLYGAPRGSIGLFGALYPLGLEWKLSRLFLLIINPLGIAIPVPQIKGVPLVYPQYRFGIGLGVLAG